jgi:hypothetical protein
MTLSYSAAKAAVIQSPVGAILGVAAAIWAYFSPVLFNLVANHPKWSFLGFIATAVAAYYGILPAATPAVPAAAKV